MCSTRARTVRRTTRGSHPSLNDSQRSRQESAPRAETDSPSARKTRPSARPIQSPLTQQPSQVFCRIGLYEIKRAGLRPALRGLCGSGRAASGRSLRRSPARSAPSGTPAGLAGAGDEGEGNGAATFRTASRPSTLTRLSTTTRMVSMPKRSTGMQLLVFRALGHDQPRDSHVHGAPHARAKPTAQLMQYERGVCARRTATKYRNTTATTRRLAGLGAARTCSATNIVAAAGSSGRRAADG